jgi:NAD(P)-dependent dehydrogenase (short-subunit alcohol dehydrogenase family)
MEANLFAPLVIDQLVLPQMIARGGGTLINMGSLAAYSSPRKPGGWGMGYAVSKGALQRVAGMLRAELGEQGIRCFNLQPGAIAETPGRRGAPPEVAGKVARWLCTSPEAAGFNGQTIEAQPFCHERGLLPGWAGPEPEPADAFEYDLAGYNLQQLTQALRGDG